MCPYILKSNKLKLKSTSELRKLGYTNIQELYSLMSQGTTDYPSLGTVVQDSYRVQAILLCSEEAAHLQEIAGYLDQVAVTHTQPATQILHF